MDIELAKKDVVYFVEQYLGFELNDWQKEVLLLLNVKE